MLPVFLPYGFQTFPPFSFPAFEPTYPIAFSPIQPINKLTIQLNISFHHSPFSFPLFPNGSAMFGLNEHKLFTENLIFSFQTLGQNPR
jgi:hypothetical protein